LKSKFILVLIVFASFFATSTEAKTPMKKKFVNPATQFNGTWRVVSYDFREFDAAPEDLEKQLNAMEHEFAVFPINLELTLENNDSFVLPGSINPETMTSPLPSAENLWVKLPSSSVKMLCKRSSWEVGCRAPIKSFEKEFLMIQLYKWDKDWVAYDKNSRTKIAYRKVWHDISPITYKFLDVGRTYSFDAWVAKNGDLLITISIDINSAQSKNPDRRTLGIRLKRI
jgi:hypothetical protein